MLFTNIAWSENGHESGNGGHDVALEFSLLGDAIHQHLKSLPSDIIFSSQQMEGFHHSLKNTKIFIQQEPLCYSNKPCQFENSLVAKNYPSLGKIEINELRWLKLNYWKKIALVTHEHLGIMGMESNTYHYTSAIIKSMDHPSVKVDFSAISSQDMFRINHVLLAGRQVIVKKAIYNISSLAKILCHKNGLKSKTWSLRLHKKPRKHRHYMLFNEMDNSFKLIIDFSDNRQRYRVVSDLDCLLVAH